MVSKALMCVWVALDILLLAACVLTLALSVVWRAPNTLINMVLSSAALNGTILFLAQLLRAKKDYSSWRYLRSCVIDHFHHLHGCYHAAESCYNWPGTAELCSPRRCYGHPNYRVIYLVLYFTRTG